MSYDKALVAPFPWFGGKRNIASEVWARLGPTQNYVEPFFGSGAVLLARPDQPKTETVNDIDLMLCNFWRAIKASPVSVAEHVDHPVSEADLQARHYWLITEGRERIAACLGDPDHHDAKVAGWWRWGACAWIGTGWCSGEGPWAWTGKEWLDRKLPHFGNAGQGINRQLPHFGDAGRGNAILQWLCDLSIRLRDVRVACGDWSRVCGDSVTWRHGLTGVFLDPPYGVEDRASIYTHDCREVSHQAREWAIAAGCRADMRIAFSGYQGEHQFPADWSEWRWKARGGYGSQGDDDGRANCRRETVWFSPACIDPAQRDLFAPRRADLDDAYQTTHRELFA